jgi:hypothetical protein
MRTEYVSLIERGLGDHLLRGSDYTNKTKALAEERRQAEAWIQQERQKLQLERQKLDGWYNQVQGELQEYESVKKEVLPKVAAYEQALKDYRLDDGRPILDAVNVPQRTIPPAPSYQPPANPTNPQVTNKYLTVDDANKFGGNLLNLMKTVTKIGNEHQRLFGQPLDDDLIEHFTETGQDPYEHWRVKYAVDNRKAELAQQQRDAEYAKMKEEARAEALREIASDPSRVMGAPFSSPKGGLTPVMEQYAHSRATTYSQNHSTDKAAVDGKNDFVPPEMRSDIAAGRDRVNGAVELFHKNWDVTGTPISEKGRELSRKYIFND